MIMKVSFSENHSLMKADFGEFFEIVDAELPYYEGSYIVTPAVTGQILTTEQRIMRKDLVIEKIPFYKVSNNKGGDTVTIG